MPTIARLGAIRVVVYPNDHRPAHVHLIGAGKESVWDLNCPDGPAELRENFGFPTGELRKLKVQLARLVTALCTEWSGIHDVD